MEIITSSAKETKKLGELLAREIARSPALPTGRRASNKRAVVLSLEGDLGSGKTTFVQGMAKGFEIKKIPRSPTFIIMQAFEIPKRHLHLVHIDAYRISGRDLKTLGWDKLIKDSRNIIVVEWGARLKRFLPKDCVRIAFGHGKKFNERTISISN